MSLNKVLLMGNCVADPIVKDFNGVKMASIRVATSERVKKADGTYTENTEYHNVSAWRKTAEVVEKYLRKGSPVFVEGRIRNREYTDRDGAKKWITEIVCDSLQLLGRNENSHKGNENSQREERQDNTYGASSPLPPINDNDPDPLPF